MIEDLTEAWQEWHTTCALDRCSPEHISQLCTRSNSIYKKAVESLPQNMSCIEHFGKNEEKNPSKETLRNELRYTFRLMEIECLPPGSVEERRKYKDRIFARAKNDGAVTGYFLKSFFRSYVKSKRNMSLNTADDNLWEDDNISKEDFLENLPPDSNNQHDLHPDELVSKDYFNKIAALFWKDLTETERAALYAYGQHCTMSSPELLKKVGRGKSVFVNLPIKLITRYAIFVQDRYSLGNGKIVKPSIDIPKELWGKQKLDLDVLSSMFEALQYCYADWEQTSPLGQWLKANMVVSDGKKTKFKTSPEI